MATETIGATEFDVYDSLADVDAYLSGSLSSQATAWRAADDDTRKRGLVQATRTFDALPWDGQRTDDAQLHAWPRTGLTYADGSEVDSATTPSQVLDGFAELSALLVEGKAAEIAANQASGVKRMKAGSVELEYFTPQLADAPPLVPGPVLDLVGRWLAGYARAAAAFAGGDAFDTCTPSSYREYGLNRGQ